MRHGLGNAHPSESIQQCLRSRKVDPTIVLGATGELAALALGVPLDQHPLSAAYHRTADALCLRIELRLQPQQPALRDLVRHLIRERSGRRPGSAAVEKAE